MPNTHGQPQAGEEVALVTGFSAVIKRYERTLPTGAYVVSLQRPCRQEFAVLARFDVQEAFWSEEVPVRAIGAGTAAREALPWWRRALKGLRQAVFGED